MLSISDAILRSDFSHLSKEDLKSICIDLDLADNGTISDLSTRIWEKIENNKTLRDQALQSHSDRLYAGKTSITWYSLVSGASLTNSKNKIKEYLKRDPFESFFIPPKEDLRSEPTVIGGVTQSDTEYYLRFMYKSGTIPIYQGNELIQIPITSVVTMYIDESTGCIEVRANSKKAGNVISKFAKLIEQTNTISPRKIMEKYGNNIEEIATRISGTFIDSTSKPELLLKDLNHNQAESVFQMLKALDIFFEDDDIDGLRDGLNGARECLGEGANGVPFTALVLAGLDKVGLGVTGSDLRDNQLYKYLNEYMEHQGGFIRFDHEGNSYTIRVGSGTNSITFLTPATESAIKYIRDNIIIH